MGDLRFLARVCTLCYCSELPYISNLVNKDMSSIYLYVHTYIYIPSHIYVCGCECVNVWVCVAYTKSGTYLQTLVGLQMCVKWQTKQPGHRPVWHFLGLLVS